MKKEWELEGKLKHNPRITWVEEFFRRTSLDKLAQLWNVLLGHRDVSPN